jgi:hypothetical protein
VPGAVVGRATVPGIGSFPRCITRKYSGVGHLPHLLRRLLRIEGFGVERPPPLQRFLVALMPGVGDGGRRPSERRWAAAGRARRHPGCGDRPWNGCGPTWSGGPDPWRAPRRRTQSGCRACFAPGSSTWPWPECARPIGSPRCQPRSARPGNICGPTSRQAWRRPAIETPTWRSHCPVASSSQPCNVGRRSRRRSSSQPAGPCDRYCGNGTPGCHPRPACRAPASR